MFRELRQLLFLFGHLGFQLRVLLGHAVVVHALLGERYDLVPVHIFRLAEVLELKQLAVCLRLLLLVLARLCGICILPAVVLFDLRRGVVALCLRVRRALRVVLDVGKAVRRDVAPIVCVRRKGGVHFVFHVKIPSPAMVGGCGAMVGATC